MYILSRYILYKDTHPYLIHMYLEVHINGHTNMSTCTEIFTCINLCMYSRLHLEICVCMCNHAEIHKQFPEL